MFFSHFPRFPPAALGRFCALRARSEPFKKRAKDAKRHKAAEGNRGKREKICIIRRCEARLSMYEAACLRCDSVALARSFLRIPDLRVSVSGGAYDPLGLVRGLSVSDHSCVLATVTFGRIWTCESGERQHARGRAPECCYKPTATLSKIRV